MLLKGLYAALTLTALITQSIGTDVGAADNIGNIGEATGEPTRTFPDIQPRAGDSRCSPGTWSSKGTTPCNDCSAGSYSKGTILCHIPFKQ